MLANLTKILITISISASFDCQVTTLMQFKLLSRNNHRGYEYGKISKISTTYMLCKY